MKEEHIGHLKKGDWIKCHDSEDLKETLNDLGDEGYGATVTSGNYIRITSVPKQDTEDRPA